MLKSILKPIAITLFLLSVLPISVGEAQQLEFTLKGELPPVRASYSELLQLGNDINEIIGKAKLNNAEKISLPDYIEYEVYGPGSSLKGSSLDSILKNPQLPSKALMFSLYMKPRNALVTTVRISMQESYGSWEVAGTDKIFLDALRNRIEAFEQEHATWMGGPLVQMLLFFLAFFTTLGFLFSAADSVTSKQTVKATIQFIVCVSIGAFAVYHFASGNVKYWFPRTAIYKGSSSFIERYSAEIGLWGLILTIVGIVLTVIFSKKPLKQENLGKTSPAQSTPPTDSSKSA